jgi:hypothetical protein
MTIHPRPDQETQIQEAMRAGLIRSAEDVIDAGLEHLRLAPVLALGAYARAKPPKKQVVQGGGLNWEDSVPTASEIKTLIIYVRRIRNNLFHGGKFPEGPMHDVARDTELLRSGVSVLKALLIVPGLPAGIKHHFEEGG